jgi:hypothetical protein
MIRTFCDPDLTTCQVLVRPGVSILQTHEQAVVSALIEAATVVLLGDGIRVHPDAAAPGLAAAVTTVLRQAETGVHHDATAEMNSEFRNATVCTLILPDSIPGLGWRRTCARVVVGSVSTSVLVGMTECSPNAAIAVPPVMSIGA